MHTKRRCEVMEVTLPADLTNQVDQQIAAGHFKSSDERIQRAADRTATLRRIGEAVDRTGLYERVYIPSQ